jgi:RNase adaptor protein for sRNA GlmZ degradation
MRGGLAIDRFVVISGCSGGGKSALLEELGRQGYPTVEEPGRRISRSSCSVEARRSHGRMGSRSLGVASRWPFQTVERLADYKAGGCSLIGA